MWPPDTSRKTDGRLQVRLLEQRGVEVGLEVVHGHEGDVPHQGERLRRAQPDQQRPDQTRADGGAHRVDVVVADPGLDQGPGHHRRERLDVGAAGDLGHDAAEAGVQLDLAGRPPTTARGGRRPPRPRRSRRTRSRCPTPECRSPRRPQTPAGRPADQRAGQVGVEALDPGRGGRSTRARRDDGRSRPDRRRGPTSPWHPHRSRRSSCGGSQPARTRRPGTGPAPRRCGPGPLG